MKTPRVALNLITENEVVKDKPTWQRRLYARLQERAGDEDTKVTYAIRDESAKNPTRKFIQRWYEQIYSELARAYAESNEANTSLQNNVGHLQRAINNSDQTIHDLMERSQQIEAERDGLLKLIARAHTAEAQVEDYVNMYGQS